MRIEVNIARRGLQRRRRRLVRLGGKECQHISVHVDLEAAHSQDVRADVELAVLELREQQRWIDVGLGHEVAEMRCCDVVLAVLLVFV